MGETKKIVVLALVFSMIFSNMVFAKNFNDVEGHWAETAIEIMNQQGIINGYPDGSFKPNEKITREQFAKLITLTFNLSLENNSNTFSDIKEGHWSYAYVEASKDFLTGYFPPMGQPFFSPASYATREDVAVALVRAMEMKGNLEYTKGDLNSFKDF